MDGSIGRHPWLGLVIGCALCAPTYGQTSLKTFAKITFLSRSGQTLHSLQS